MALDKLASKLDIEVSKKGFKGIYGEKLCGGQKILLLKPETYMNLSGESVVEAVNFYKIDISSELIIIYDDIDIDFGNIRIRRNGSAGTHNGMKNIIQMLGTDNFIRVRVGTGRPMENIDLVEYVLMRLNKDEKIIAEKSLEIAGDAVIEIVEKGIQDAMNKYN